MLREIGVLAGTLVAWEFVAVADFVERSFLRPEFVVFAVTLVAGDCLVGGLFPERGTSTVTFAGDVIEGFSSFSELDISDIFLVTVSSLGFDEVSVESGVCY